MRISSSGSSALENEMTGGRLAVTWSRGGEAVAVAVEAILKTVACVNWCLRMYNDSRHC